jgi:hypothetical protein
VEAMVSSAVRWCTYHIFLCVAKGAARRPSFPWFPQLKEASAFTSHRLLVEQRAKEEAHSVQISFPQQSLRLRAG